MVTYRDAGVDLEAGEEALRRIKPLVRETFTPGVMTDIGAFGAFFALDVSHFNNPVLVSSVDGVGTKLKVAFRMNRHDTVGEDLVNHCVNDIAVCGAEPLYFLDYFSTGKLCPEVVEDIVRGFSKGCIANGCALIGGETAEMPGLYNSEEYDLAGTIVGIVERDRILGGGRVQAGDVLIGLSSTGLHTNGYSLARKVLFGLFQAEDRPDELNGASVGESLLAVHRSYLNAIRVLCHNDLVHAMVHVTGGGIPGNTPRVIPDGLNFTIDYMSWQRNPIFDLIQKSGDVPEVEMRRTFNLGIGLIAVVPEENADQSIKILSDLGERPQVVGSVSEKS